MRVIRIALAMVLLGCASADRPLQLLAGDGPTYPSQAQADGVQGYVVVRYAVSAAGEVRNPEVVESVPSGVFDQAALAAVRTWRYKAPVEQGSSVAVSAVTSTVRFVLNDDDPYAEYE